MTENKTFNFGIEKDTFYIIESGTDNVKIFSDISDGLDYFVTVHESIINDLKKENQELKHQLKELEETIDTICEDYEDAHGMSIRNAEWFTAW